MLKVLSGAPGRSVPGVLPVRKSVGNGRNHSEPRFCFVKTFESTLLGDNWLIKNTRLRLSDKKQTEKQRGSKSEWVSPTLNLLFSSALICRLISALFLLSPSSSLPTSAHIFPGLISLLVSLVYGPRHTAIS
ncbi:hypothetical protein GOODEAATRI_004322 [Goodea atripinnis]|uniref:Uncharacterized protein n=1 Tax=Goodea atripinnis TaxID=208336 RepID=A0ABV0NIF8_9TELE